MDISTSKTLVARMTDWSRFRVELRWAYEGEVRPRNLHLPSKVEPGYPAYFIRKGSLAIATEDTELEVGPGSWVISPQPMLRRDFAPGTEVISIRFELARPDGSSLFNIGLPMAFRDEAYPELMQYARSLLDSLSELSPTTYSDSLRKQSDLDSYLLVRERFYAWLRCLVKIYCEVNRELAEMKPFDDRTRAALEFLDAQPLDADMPESIVASQVGLSVSQLNRIFAKDLGKTPKQYWDYRKLNAAVVLLSSTMKPIKQVAFELGFKSQNYFARWFRSHTSLTPSNYREQYNHDWRQID